ncbi:MAG: hypothetical protein RI591_05125 [Dehalococcoidia bacterium]|nr:hypothetical protein [Dehalococcoidia bacterium]
MTTIIDILDELEKVRLAPLLVPVLKASDPLMGALPEGSLKSMMAHKGTQTDLVKTVEGLAPLFPTLIRYAGHLAESKLATGIISLMVNITTPIMKPFNPLMAKMVVPSIGPSLKLTNTFAPLFPLFIKVSDSFWRMEVGIERIFRGSKSQ